MMSRSGQVIFPHSLRKPGEKLQQETGGRGGVGEEGSQWTESHLLAGRGEVCDGGGCSCSFSIIFFAGTRRKPRFFILIIIMFIFLSFETNRKRIIIMRTTLSSERPSCDKAPHRAPHLRCCCSALEQGTTVIHLRAPVTRSVMGTSISRISAGLGPACWRCGQPAVLGCGGVTAGCLGGQNIPSLKVLREGT